VLRFTLLLSTSTTNVAGPISGHTVYDLFADCGCMNCRVRTALAADEAAITKVVLAAFGGNQGRDISELVSALLADATARPVISLVAEVDGHVIGHILFTGARLEGSFENPFAAILAPLSVHPEHQGRGVGGRLIREGLKEVKAAGCDLVFVLGHPTYYPKHGFVIAGVNGFEAPYLIPPEHADAWMVQELRMGTIGKVRGRVVCAESLNHPRHWRE
jgi:putative acetyltransferase